MEVFVMKNKLMKLILKNWDTNYGIFRPAKDYTFAEWIQFIIVCTVYYVGLYLIGYGIGEYIAKKQEEAEEAKATKEKFMDNYERLFKTNEEEDA
jgi:hypothetical protein